jgi:plastocyanin
MVIRIAIILVVAMLYGCTAGGVDPTSTGSASVTNVTKIDVSIAAFPLSTTPAGPARGFSPEVTDVAVGSGVQFVNTDNTTHTATSIAGATSYPTQSPFGIAALQPSASANLSGNWGAGALQAGQASQVFIVDEPGTYIYGCFFHYSGGMRGEIIAQ